MIDSNLMSEIQDAAAQGKDTLAPQSGYEVGATYLISHTRKGRFFMRVTGQSDEWLNGIVAAGFNEFKAPKLGELYTFLFGDELVGAHDAMVDVQACMACFFEMKARKNAAAA